MATLYPVLPTLKYDQSSQANYNVRTITTEFGDGYQQVQPDGINFNVQTGTLTHRLLSLADAATLRAFLETNCGTSSVITILNMMEDPTGATTLNVYLQSYRVTNLGSHFNYTINYREAFNV